MLCDRKTHRAGQLVACTFYEVGERQARIKLRVYLLRLHGIEQCRRLVYACSRSLLVDISHWLRLYDIRLAMLLVCKDAVVELETRTEGARENLAQQVSIVLLNIFIDEHAGQLHQDSSRVFVETLENHRLKQCAELLFRDILLYQSERFVPESLGSLCH